MLFDAFWYPIHSFISYFDDSSTRASSYKVYVLIGMIGWGLEGSGEFRIYFC